MLPRSLRSPTASFQKSSIILAVCWGLVACGATAGKDKEKSDSASVAYTPFLAMTDFAPGTIVKTPSTELVSEFFAGNGKLIHHKAAVTKTDPKDVAYENCTNEQYKKLFVKAKGDSVLVDGTIDLGSCSQGKMNSSTFTVKSTTLTLRILLYMQCDGFDFEKFNGKSFYDLDKASSEGLCKGSPQRKIYMGMEMNSSIVATVSNTMNFEQVIRHREFQADAQGKPCVIPMSGQNLKTDGCLQVERHQYIKDAMTWIGTPTAGVTLPESKTGKEDYSRYEAAGLLEPDDATTRWYIGGKYKVTLNDWTGEVTYTSGTTPPNYSVTNGAETKSGAVLEAAEPRE